MRYTRIFRGLAPRKPDPPSQNPKFFTLFVGIWVPKNAAFCADFKTLKNSEKFTYKKFIFQQFLPNSYRSGETPTFLHFHGQQLLNKRFLHFSSRFRNKLKILSILHFVPKVKCCDDKVFTSTFWNFKAKFTRNG